jgi:golgi SNAP receptor complex member 2
MFPLPSFPSPPDLADPSIVSSFNNVAKMNSLYNQALKQSSALYKDLYEFEQQITSSTSSSFTSSTTALQRHYLKPKSVNLPSVQAKYK